MKWRPPVARALAAAAGPCQLVGGQADDMTNQGPGARGQGPGEEGEPGPGEEGEPGPSGPGWAAACGFADQPANHPNPLDFLESIHSRKTGAMIRASLRLGALTAGASQGQRTALDEYGRRLGLAFQITDDLLDVRSDEATVGKRVGKDAQQGKLTFPGLLGVDRSAAYAQQQIAEACAALSPLGAAAAGLETLARYVLERNH